MTENEDRPLEIARRLADRENVDLSAEKEGLDTELARGFEKLRQVMGSPESSASDETRTQSLEASSQPSPSQPDAERRIGRYLLIRKLGEGGMGVVWEAEQDRPRRRVALKVIRGGVHVDDAALKLFQREVQTLALLQHPGIASLYDSGATEDRLHWFAMELVRGVTLRAWLDGRPDGPVTPAELKLRLRVFRKVCEAVAYAHQRGVIHRDLKPANVLVPADGSAAPHAVPDIKILDFGLARITESDTGMTSYHTEIGRVRGTLPYMSPEQVRGNPADIDLRTDVYALGVMLYEMVTGKLPLDLTRASLVDAMRVICEEPPRSISATYSGTRRLDPDVITIASKALEKDPARRYQSAAALGDDVQHWLDDEPILARPPSATYQFRKLVMRHKLPFAFAGVVFVLLAVLAGAMAVQAARIARERDRANLEANAAGQVSEFLMGLFTVSDPNESKGNKLTAREILDVGSRKIQVELADQPLLQARLMDTIGTVYGRLGLDDVGRPLRERALAIRESNFGKDSLEVAESLISVGGEANYRRALEIREKLLGPDNIDTAWAVYYLSWNPNFDVVDDRVLVLERALRIFEKQPDPANKGAAWALNDLAIIEYRKGDYPKAKTLLEKSLAIKEHLFGPVHSDVAVGLNNVASVLLKMGDYPAARPLLERALAIDEQILPPEHVALGMPLHTLGELLRTMGRPDAAKPYLERAAAIFEKQLPDSGALAFTLVSLALALDALGSNQEGEAILQRALIIDKTPGHVNGIDAILQADSLAQYARVLRNAGHVTQADRFDAYSRALRAAGEVPHSVSRELDTTETGARSGAPARIAPHGN